MTNLKYRFKKKSFSCISKVKLENELYKRRGKISKIINKFCCEISILKFVILLKDDLVQ